MDRGSAQDDGSQTGGHRLPPASPTAAFGVRPRSDDTAALPTAYETLGPYRLVEQVGEGGMGVVHKALDRDGREVAIKVLRSHIAYDTGARERLRREVSTLARVRSESVAEVLDADVDGDQPYLVTRFVPGPPLDDVVDGDGPLGAERLVELGGGLADALRAIHDAGVVHRDVKPGNVLMDGDRPVLIDFGIAHVADDVRLTATGLVMGTPGYLSPEIVEGAPVSQATDWWGWAATLAFAASGQAPFGRGPMHVVLDRVTRGQADLTGVDERLAPLLAAALSPHPHERPTADEVLEQLRVYADGGHTGELRVRGSGPGGAALGGAGAWSAAEWSGPRDERAPAADQESGPQPAFGGTSGSGIGADSTRQFEGADATEQFGSGGYAAQGQPGYGSTVQQGYGGAVQQGHGQGGATAYGPGAVDPYAGARHDPRIGQPARTWTLAALLAAAVGISALWPLVGIALIVLWSFAARWADRAMTSMVMRRYNAGPRRSDTAVAVLSSPWHGVTAFFATVLSALIPVFVGACTAAIVALGFAMAGDGQTHAGRPLPIAAGVLVACWTLWWGPGSASMRRGSRSMVRGAVRGQQLTRVIVGLLVVVAVGATLWSLTHLETQVSAWPLTPDQIPFGGYLPSLPGR